MKKSPKNPFTGSSVATILVTLCLAASPAFAVDYFHLNTSAARSRLDVAADYSTTNGSTTPAAAGTINSVNDNLFFYNSAVTGPVNREFVLGATGRSIGSLTFGSNAGTTQIDRDTLSAGSGSNTVLSVGAGGITVAADAGAVTFGSLATERNQRVTIRALANFTVANNSSNNLSFIRDFDNNNTGSRTITVAGSGNGDTIFNLIGQQAGTGSFNMAMTINKTSGSGVVRFNGVNTYTGLTTVTAGKLVIGASGSMVSGNALTVAAGTAEFANAGQTLGAVSNSNTAADALNFSASTGTVTLASLTGAGKTRFGSTGTVTGGISTGTVTSVGALNANISGGTITAGGLLTGTISSGTIGAGSLSSTSVTGGTTTVGGVATIGTLSSGTANLNGSTSSITTLNGGTVNLGSSAVLIVSGGSSSGAITGTGGALTKNTAGTLTLSGTNTYTGATMINAGTLELTATGTIDNTSEVSLGTAGTFNVSAKGLSGYTVEILKGSGDVIGALSVSTTLAIGNSPGTVNFSSNLTLDAGSTYLYELTSGPNPGLNSADLGDVAGDLTISAGSILDLVQLGSYTANNKFTLFAYDGTLSGTFMDLSSNILTDGATFTDAGGIWVIDYNDTSAGVNGGVSASNTYVTITAIPEPNFAALIGGFGMLTLLRRRR